MQKQLTYNHIALTLLTALLLLAPLSMQATRIDSLKLVVSQSTGDDKTNAYKELNKEMQSSGDADETLSMLEQWIAYERQRGNTEQESKVRWYKIALLSNYSRDDALLAEAPLQMSWFAEHQKWEYYYSTWETKASVYLYTSRMQTALREAELMLTDAQERDNSFGRVVSYQLSGIIYESMGINETAIDNLERAVTLLKSMKRDDNKMLYSLYDYLSQTLGSNDQYARELQVTDEWMQAVAEDTQRNNESLETMAGTLLSCYVQRTDALMGLQRLSEAEEALRMAEECLAQRNNPLTLYRVRFAKARLKLKQQQPIEALALLDSLMAMDMEVGGSLEKLRADAMMQLERYKEAATLYKQQYDELDSIFSRDMRTQLDELGTLYKLDEQEMADRMERVKTRNMFIYIIAGVVMLSLLLFIVLRSRSAKKLALKNRELQQANLQLQEATQRAEDSMKMKSDFIKSMSHEIRTPLNILSGFTQIITSPSMNLDHEQLTDIHKRINENTDRIVKLVNKMLELSNANTRTALERNDHVSAADIVKDTIHHTRIDSTPNVVFEWDAESPLAATQLTTHRKYAVQALGCLLDNAQKFTHEGMIAVRFQQHEGMMLFVVEDTGIGVDSDKADEIFEEFYQMDKYSEGAGIGLTVARGIARRLGGNIVLDTNYTAGARFVMSLPL